MRQTATRMALGGARYLLETDPAGATSYRHIGTSGLALKTYTTMQVANTSGAVTYTLPSGYFSAVYFVTPTVVRNTADPALGTFAMVRSYSTASVVVQLFESNTSGVLLGGFTEGLTTPSASLVVQLLVVGV